MDALFIAFPPLSAGPFQTAVPFSPIGRARRNYILTKSRGFFLNQRLVLSE
ncbi:hypothetical protein CLOLEP_01277 [[Clostridium] leptum DSM 753]|uniref:Uncharacterized protein n=1 Tax=[Clostridium] leptum DSM 753 TaxID=428125 RepID=A7VRU3_9FIRM|nr:hypothetical protein CLOLEP_01277 [[Clostridium] leptum DSM 753]